MTSRRGDLSAVASSSTTACDLRARDYLERWHGVGTNGLSLLHGSSFEVKELSENAERDRIRRLADDLRAKVLSKMDLLASSEGEITIRAFPRGKGFDIKVTVTTE